jgi:CRP-like cAMP-binding protein
MGKELNQLVKLLHELEYFQGLTQTEMEEVVRAGKLCQFLAGESLFQEGAPSAGLFILTEGEVHLHKLAQDGKLAILAVFHPVTIFNEVPAFDGGPNAVTAVADSSSIAWNIGGEMLNRLIVQHPRMALQMLKVLASRNRYLVGQYQDLTTRPVLARCAKLLYELSEQGHLPIPRHKHPSYQMAARIATVPEIFSRSLKTLKEAGVIIVQERTIQITNREKLIEIARM